MACAAAPKKWRRPSQPGSWSPHQAEVGLVDQGGRLERLAGRQPAGQRRGQAAQLRVDDRQQFRRRLHFRLGPVAPLVGHGTTSGSPGEENRKS